MNWFVKNSSLCLDNLVIESIDFNQYEYIPAVKYRQTIIKKCDCLKLIGNINLLCLAIATYDGKLFYMSNNPSLSVAYIASGLYRADNFFVSVINNDQEVFFPHDIKEIDPLQRVVTDFLETGFNIYNTYCLLRKTDDCKILMAVTHSSSLDNKNNFYKQTKTDVENFSIDFLNDYISIYEENLPQLKHTRFAKEALYRSNVIKNKIINDKMKFLTPRETECLHWISRGKTALEIAMLLGISEYTVIEHKKSILKKMNASNIVHAVRQAIVMGIIS